MLEESMVKGALVSPEQVHVYDTFVCAFPSEARFNAGTAPTGTAAAKARAHLASNLGHSSNGHGASAETTLGDRPVPWALNIAPIVLGKVSVVVVLLGAILWQL